MNFHPYAWSTGGHFGGPQPCMTYPSMGVRSPMANQYAHALRRLQDPYLRGGYCCPLCDTISGLPDMDNVFDGLSMADPYRYNSIMDLYNSVHQHYLMGYEGGGRESHYIAHEIERSAKLLQSTQRHNPWCGVLVELAMQLKCMSRQKQRQPRRLEYPGMSMIPRHFYMDASRFKDDMWFS